MREKGPSYLALHLAGALEARAREARALLSPCRLCARACGADRLGGKVGYCRAPLEIVVSSAGPHFGEEPPLVGRSGSGTIFLARCPLLCVFCQNWEISHLGRGTRVGAGDLASMMLHLQRLGCHNINLVTPSHYLPQILEALPEAVEGGLALPLVWNCGGYERVEALRLLEGIVDIYMPDFKFAEAGAAGRYCGAADYPERAMEALREMQRQVGDLEVDRGGIARRGLIIRHLVMPGMLADTRRVLEFIAREISADAYVNIMDQYRPAWEADRYPELMRGLAPGEHSEALSLARDLGLRRGF